MNCGFKLKEIVKSLVWIINSHLNNFYNKKRKDYIRPLEFTLIILEERIGLW